MITINIAVSANPSSCPANLSGTTDDQPTPPTNRDAEIRHLAASVKFAIGHLGKAIMALKQGEVPPPWMLATLARCDFALEECSALLFSDGAAIKPTGYTHWKQ